VKGTGDILSATDPDFIFLVIGRSQIESGDISEPLSVLRRLLDRSAAVRFCEHVDIGVHGFDDDSRELYDIPEVRDFIYRLDKEFPYWLYFLTKRGLGLQFVLFCFLPDCLNPAEQPAIAFNHLTNYLENRGFLAMNNICAFAGCSYQEIERLTDRVMAYVVNGPDKGES
jgi:hypothetical protein